MAYFPCKEGMGEILLPAVLEGLSDTRAFEGNISINTFVDQDNPDRIVLWEKWETRKIMKPILHGGRKPECLKALSLS